MIPFVLCSWCHLAAACGNFPLSYHWKWALVDCGWLALTLLRHIPLHPVHDNLVQVVLNWECVLGSKDSESSLKTIGPNCPFDFSWHSHMLVLLTSCTIMQILTKFENLQQRSIPTTCHDCSYSLFLVSTSTLQVVNFIIVESGFWLMISYQVAISLHLVHRSILLVWIFCICLELS